MSEWNDLPDGAELFNINVRGHGYIVPPNHDDPKWHVYILQHQYRRRVDFGSYHSRARAEEAVFLFLG